MASLKMNISAAIHELHTKAASGGDILELLRSALRVSHHLKHESFRQWLLQERVGYGKADVPKYRRLTTQLYGRHPNFGLQAVSLPAWQLEELVLEVPCKNAISELVAVSMNQDGTPAAAEFDCPFPDAVHRPLVSYMGVPGARYTRRIQHCQFVKLFEGVRDRILDEALALEGWCSSEGELDFGPVTATQRETSVTNFNIGTFQGNLFSGSSSGNVQMAYRCGADLDQVSRLLESLRNMGIPDAECDALRSAIEYDGQHTNENPESSAVKKWINALTTKVQNGLIDVGSGASANLIAALVAQQLGWTS